MKHRRAEGNVRRLMGLPRLAPRLIDQGAGTGQPHVGSGVTEHADELATEPGGDAVTKAAGDIKPGLSPAWIGITKEAERVREQLRVA